MQQTSCNAFQITCLTTLLLNKEHDTGDPAAWLWPPPWAGQAVHLLKLNRSYYASITITLSPAATTGLSQGKTATKKLREMTCLTSMNCNAEARAQGTNVWLWPCNGSIGKEKMKTRKAIFKWSLFFQQLKIFESKSSRKILMAKEGKDRTTTRPNAGGVQRWRCFWSSDGLCFFSLTFVFLMNKDRSLCKYP